MASEDRATLILADYRSQKHIYDDLSEAIKELLERLLEEAKIRVHSITFRGKEPEMLEEKLNRPGKEYTNLKEVTDLAGIRVIAYFGDDVDAIGTLIESEFLIDQENSIDKRQTMEPDRFGYLSMHYVCSLTEPRVQLMEYRRFAGYLFEIQVRSILQHAWAEIEHDLGYKAKEEIPVTLRRRFSRLAGLLEVADDDFMRIRDDLTKYTLQVREQVMASPDALLIDAVSLEAFIKQDPIFTRLDEEIAANVGGVLKTPSVSISEHRVQEMQLVGLQTIEDVRKALQERKGQVIGYSNTVRQGRSFSVSRGVSLYYLFLIMIAESGDEERVTSLLAKAKVTGSASQRAQFARRLISRVRNLPSSKALI